MNENEINVQLTNENPQLANDRATAETAVKLWKDQTENGMRLPEPFTSVDIRAVTGTTKGGAESQLRRWIYWRWVKNVAYGKYVRTPNFGGEKQHIGYNPSRKKPTGHHGRRNPANVQLKCEVSGCSFIGYGVDMRAAKGSLGRHKSAEHGMKKRYIPVAERRRLGYSANTRNGIVTSNFEPAPAPVAAAAPEPEFVLFCPHCGHNLEMHKTAYRIARKHSRI